MLTGTRLAVWGDPIDHSLSPRLHAAAYAELDLPWEYGRRRVGEEGFAAALAGLDARWRGLSLTMPLKHVAAQAAVERDDHALRTGAVNTLVLQDDGAHGFNTDVGGLVRALEERGVEEVVTARILGAGATATSALVALVELGARRVEVVARRPAAVRSLVTLGEALGTLVVAGTFPAYMSDAAVSPVDVTVATLPGGTDLGDVARSFAEDGGLLVDVVYGGWPTPLAKAWAGAGHDAVSGHGMLLHQALLQVRIFTGGDPNRPVEDEPGVIAAMRSALVGG